MVRLRADRQQPGVDARVERLHAPVEHLREAGVVLHGARLDAAARRARARCPRWRRSPRRAPPARARSRPARACPTRSAARAGCARRPGALTPALARLNRHRRPAPPAGCAGSGRTRPAAIRRTARGNSRCSTPCTRSSISAMPRRIRKLERLLKHDRPAVHALVDEVHGHTGHLDPVLDRALDRPQARERRQQRRVHVHDPAREAPDELGREQLHEAGQDDQVDPERLEPVAQGAVALLALGVLRRSRRRPTRRRRPPLAPARAPPRARRPRPRSRSARPASAAGRAAPAGWCRCPRSGRRRERAPPLRRPPRGPAGAAPDRGRRSSPAGPTRSARPPAPGCRPGACATELP